MRVPTTCVAHGSKLGAHDRVRLDDLEVDDLAVLSNRAHHDEAAAHPVHREAVMRERA